MRYKVKGVHAETGKVVAPIIVEADGEPGAAHHAKNQGIVATKVQKYTEPASPAPYVPPRAKGPSQLPAATLFLFGVLVLISGLLSTNDPVIGEKTVGDMIGSATTVICGTIFIAVAFIVDAVNKFHRESLHG